jgi:hypothetical protein
LVIAKAVSLVDIVRYGLAMPPEDRIKVSEAIFTDPEILQDGIGIGNLGGHYLWSLLSKTHSMYLAY